jgi:hypothetical protein
MYFVTNPKINKKPKTGTIKKRFLAGMIKMISEVDCSI